METRQSAHPGVQRPPSLMRSAWIVSMLLAAGAVAAMAQEGPQPAAGSRVRLMVEAGTEPVEGTLAGWTDKSLRVTLSGKESTVAVPRARIVRLERMTRPSRRGKGALVGAAILGGVVAAIALGCYGAGECAGGETFWPVPWAVGIGAGLGALLAPGAQWEDVPLAQVRPRDGTRLSLGLAPGGGVAASLSIGF